nr:uncharacterized protein LOC118681841 isoform X2 [Bactrocera oleae]
MGQCVRYIIKIRRRSFLDNTSGPISAIPTNEQPFRQNRTCAQFQIDISKTETNSCMYNTTRQTGLRRFFLGVTENGVWSTLQLSGG